MSDILTPNFGESVTSATVAAWHKNAGDPVAKGDTLVTLETDKVSTDLEAEESGVLEILVPEGEEALIGAVLGRISSADRTAAAPERETLLIPLESRKKRPRRKHGSPPFPRLPPQLRNFRDKSHTGKSPSRNRFLPERTGR